MSTIPNMPAVRALRRIWNPISEALAAEQESYDRHFDAGEYSASFFGRAQEELYAAALLRVALRFSLTADELDRAVEEHAHAASCHEWAARQRRQPPRLGASDYALADLSDLDSIG